MASNSETGHAKNVANFENLITSITAFGPAYNPNKNSIKLPELQSVLDQSKVALNAVNIAHAAFSNAVAARETAFEPFSKLTTRINNALKASDTTVNVNDNVKTIVRKLQGRRASAKISDEEKQALEADGKVVNQISAAQMSFDSRIENFDKLIMLLASVPAYSPNEEDLKLDALKAYHNLLKTKNNDVLVATVQLSNARIKRNELLYKPLVGLVSMALDAKVYLKSVFGVSNPNYKQISKLSFKSIDL